MFHKSWLTEEQGIRSKYGSHGSLENDSFHEEEDLSPCTHCFHFSHAIRIFILKMEQQQHNINLRRTRKKNPSPRWDLNPRPPVI